MGLFLPTPEDLSQALTALSTSDVRDPNLYIDTGANAHVTNDPGKLSNIQPYNGYDKIVVRDGSRLKI